MEEKKWDPTVMDNAASDAENDLLEVDEEALRAVANWWKKWFGKAGHKRLGRILLQYSSESSGNGNNKIALNPNTNKFEQVADE